MRVKVAGAAVLLAAVVSAGVAGAERIDRVLAVVSGTVITESDVRAAISFGLLRPFRPGDDPIRAALDQLIRRQLILGEVLRSTAGTLDPTRVAARLDAIRARFPSRDAYEACLAQTAMSESRLRDIVEADMRVDDYMRQRFGGVAEPSEAEIVDYYEAHRAELTAQGRQLTLDEARPAVSARLVEERRRQLIEDWVGRLRRRADVSDLYYASAAR